MINERTPETAAGLKPILDYLLAKRGLDFSGYHRSMVERRVNERLTATSSLDFSSYLSCLHKNTRELDYLIDALTINVSGFFRDTLTFELIADRILPAIIGEKNRLHDHSLRVWSAGCAKGEEPYSLAIIIHELLEKEGLAMDVHIFATDIDSKALKDADSAAYPPASVENMKYRLLTKYFLPEGECFRLIPAIKERVTFTLYDMLDKQRGVPPESVFGNFDMVLCRNLLIYFNTEYQELILGKLYRSLAQNGYLILGETEAPTMKYSYHFTRIVNLSPIYQKEEEEKVRL